MRIITSLALLAAISTPALGDGFPNGYKEPSIRYHSAPTSYRSEPRQGIRRWLDDRDMALAKCLKRNAERRQSGLQGKDCAALARGDHFRDVVKKAPTRYAASRYPRYDAEPSRRCMASIKVTGVERTLRWRAEESARKAWRRAAIDTHGYQFASGFQEARVTCDNIRGYVWVCRASGRPCRED